MTTSGFIGNERRFTGSILLNQLLPFNPGVWIDLRPAQDPLDPVYLKLRPRRLFSNFLQDACR